MVKSAIDFKVNDNMNDSYVNDKKFMLIKSIKSKVCGEKFLNSC